MNYQELSKHAELLNYRDKLRLAQLLLQLARKEEEAQNPTSRGDLASNKSADPELVLYVAQRLKKLRPAKREALINSIESTFQFQGAISEIDVNKLIDQLVKDRHIVISAANRIEYVD